MTEKEFCESGKHSYKETDIVQSMFQMHNGHLENVWIVVACSKCDSKFLREVARPLP